MTAPGYCTGNMSLSGSRLVLENVTKRFKETAAVKDVSLTVDPGRLCCLLGPSGCGKTTILRLVAGLEQPDEGRLLLNGRDLTVVPPRRRNIGMVFQNYALFPHMNVFENIAYGLESAKISQAKIRQQVTETLELVDLPAYGNRRVNELSGGEQQRVALARALITRPAMLLLDEPFSNLDVGLRGAMRDQLSTVQKHLGITTILVTHDQEEAMYLADSIALIRKGQIEQIGTAQEVYSAPNSSAVAEFFGGINLFSAQSFARSFGKSLPSFAGSQAKYIGIRPTSLILGREGRGVRVRVLRSSFHSTMIRYRLALLSDDKEQGQELIAEQSVKKGHFGAGDEVGVTLRGEEIYLFDR